MELTVRQRIPLKGVRGTIARRLREAVTSQPQVTLHTRCAAGRLVQLHRARRAQWEQAAGAPVSLTAVLARLVVEAHKSDGRLNGCMTPEAVELYQEVHLGIAVALDDGLIVPVVHGADRLALPQLAARLVDLSGRARSGALRPEEVMGGTFTITNLGPYGVDHFTPILNPPQIAILGVGRTQEVAGAGGLQLELGLSLTFDHAAVDGARAAAWLQRLVTLIEGPDEILARE